MTEVLLHTASLIAAFFQSVTGIGFGMIAGPVILVVLNDPAAVVISTLMSWLIAAVLFPFLRRGADIGALLRLGAGAALGLPLGLAVLEVSDVGTLKLIAGFTIAGLTAMMVFGLPGLDRPGLGGDLIAGALGGFFGACLAMPGPTAAVRLTSLGQNKKTVRATMICFFCVVWPVIFLGQWATAGVTIATLWNAALLVPATLAGIFVGNYAAGRVSESFFRRLVLGILVLTSISLILNAILERGAA